VQKLSTYRSRGILISGSGNIVPTLGLVDFKNFDKDNYGYHWAIEARETINYNLIDGNFQPLLDFEKQSKAFQPPIPAPEHYLPLIYILVLKGKQEELSLFNDKLLAGSLSMTSVKIM
jgi:4,5-DOPA dioxygenase extradiol